MKGLLKKDWLALCGQGKLYVALLVFYTVLGITSKNLSMMGAFVILVSSMLPITCLSFDESCKWDRFALTMPVSRRDIVLSKYVLGLLLNLGSFGVILLFNLVAAGFLKEQMFSNITLWDVVYSSFITCILGLGILALLFPIMFRFGVEKGRYIMMAVFALCFIVPMMLSGTLQGLLGNLPGEGRNVPEWLFPVGIAAVLLLVWLVSIRVSILIYRKKEF